MSVPGDGLLFALVTRGCACWRLASLVTKACFHKGFRAADVLWSPWCLLFHLVVVGFGKYWHTMQ